MADDSDPSAWARSATLVVAATVILVAGILGGVALLGSNLATTSETDGDSTAPEGRLTVVGGSNREPVGLAPELVFLNLAEAPADASAGITVTAANGESITMFTVAPDRPPGGHSLVFQGDQDLGDQAVDLGPPPYEYSVEVTLGNETFTGTGTWPDDRADADEPGVALAFDPPLPTS